jgi:hypothetical protein
MNLILHLSSVSNYTSADFSHNFGMDRIGMDSLKVTCMSMTEA